MHARTTPQMLITPSLSSALSAKVPQQTRCTHALDARTISNFHRLAPAHHHYPTDADLSKLQAEKKAQGNHRCTHIMQTCTHSQMLSMFSLPSVSSGKVTAPTILCTRKRTIKRTSNTQTPNWRSFVQKRKHKVCFSRYLLLL